MQVDSSKSCAMLQEPKPLIDENFRYSVFVLCLARQCEPGADPRVLIKCGSLGESAQASFDHPKLRFKFPVGQSFFVHSSELKEASITTTFQRENMIVVEA